MQCVTFVPSLFAFLVALSFQARLPFIAAAFFSSALAGKRGRARLVSLFFSLSKPCVKKYTSSIYSRWW